MSGEPLVFVDTNVLIYAFSSEKSEKSAQAEAAVHRLIAEDRLCLSTQVLQEFFVVITKKMGVPQAEALEMVEYLGEYSLFRVDLKAILDAGRLCGSAQVSFWDALILIAAMRSGASVLLSEDLNATQLFGELRVENPFAAGA